MYLYFDNEGNLKEQVSKTPMRVGSSGWNYIYSYWAGQADSASYTVDITYYLEDGTQIPAPQSSALVGVAETTTLPATVKEDLFFFELGKTYKFYKFVINDNALSQAGVVRFEIRYTLGSIIRTMGWNAFNVYGASSFIPEQHIDLAQFNELKVLLDSKQDSYTAGTGIDISNDTISVDTDTIQAKLTAGDNITISNNTISATDTTYTAGNNIQISSNVISATDTKYTAGSGLNLSNANQFSIDTDIVQPKLIAGSRINIANNSISADVSGLATTQQLSDEQTARSSADTALGADITNLGTSISNVNNSLTAEVTNRTNADTLLQADINSVRQIAQGNVKTFVISKATNPAFDTQDNSVNVSTFTDVNGVTHTYSDLHVGDIILITELNIPDRWVENILQDHSFECYKLETTKVDLTDYATKTYADTKVSDEAAERLLADTNLNNYCDNLNANKQAKLTAGSNITISGATISATDTTYSGGIGININGTTINVKSAGDDAVAFASQLTSKLDATKCTYQTTAPTSAISDGGVHIVHLSAEPSTKYNGYIYFIDEA